MGTRLFGNGAFRQPIRAVGIQLLNNSRRFGQNRRALTLGKGSVRPA